MARTTEEVRFLLTARDRTRAAMLGVRSNLASIGGAASSLQTRLLALAGIGGFGFLAKGIIDVNAEFQTIKSSLKTVTGGAKEAAAAFDLIENFATTTPFALQEVVQSFIKLKALGLDPSERALRSYGNTASALGKSLDQMIEAVADAATGEFERLKEFGIKAKKNRDEVSLTFQGVTTTIGNNAAEIQKFLLGLGENQFGSAMADQMNNITPALSNLDAAFKGLAVAVGEAGLNEVVAQLVNNTTAWINSLDASKIAAFTSDTIEFFRDIAEAVDTVTDAIGRLTFDARIERGLPGAGQIPAGDANFQLGDFNRANPQNFDEWANAIRENTRAIKDNRGAVAG